MDIEVLRDLLRKRLYLELQLFKNDILVQKKEEIYKSSYKIEFYENVYEILMEETEYLGEAIVRGLLYHDQGILIFLYQEWLGQEDGIFDELQGYVGNMLENIVQIGRPACGKERGNGTEPDKAA